MRLNRRWGHRLAIGVAGSIAAFGVGFVGAEQLPYVWDYPGGGYSTQAAYFAQDDALCGSYIDVSLWRDSDIYVYTSPDDMYVYNFRANSGYATGSTDLWWTTPFVYDGYSNVWSNFLAPGVKHFEWDSISYSVNDYFDYAPGSYPVYMEPRFSDVYVNWNCRFFATHVVLPTS
ncbi:MAG: hypothetical protein ACSLFM_13670 [Tepidiformaceae bacterium]